MKTIKVQIALAVDKHGHYYAQAGDMFSVEESESDVLFWIDQNSPYHIHHVEVEVPIPEDGGPVVVQGKVVDTSVT